MGFLLFCSLIFIVYEGETKYHKNHKDRCTCINPWKGDKTYPKRGDPAITCKNSNFCFVSCDDECDDRRPRYVPRYGPRKGNCWSRKACSGPGIVCPTVYEPVCGKNGQTYKNTCEAGGEAKVQCKGKCPCDKGKCECECINPWKNNNFYKHIGDPANTCKYEGFCYVNCKCKRHCPDKKRKKHKKRCYSKTACPPPGPGDHKNCPISKPKNGSRCKVNSGKRCDYEPVSCCGKIVPNLYHQSAMCKNGKWEVVSQLVSCEDCGKEECLKKCSKGYYPKVCGSDGKEYNKCTVKCHKNEGVTKQCDGKCPCEKDQKCPDSEPEANSDCDLNPEKKCPYQEYCCCGKCQYTNTAHCGRDGKWRISSKFIHCNCKEECLKKCKKGYYPKVCGSDGKDYDECTIKCQEGPRKHLVTRKCDGSCPCDGEGKCECECINPWKKKTYYNHIGDPDNTCPDYCYVDCSCNKHCPDKKHKKHKDRCYSKTACPPTVVDPGECVKKCSKGYYPSKVCGSDGKEYDECTIKCHKQEGVTKECDGTCPCKEPECPYKRPKPFSSCSLKPEKECTYGEYCCCGECQPTDTAICLDGKWAIATARIHCNCQEECLKKCSKGEYPTVCGTDGNTYNKCTIKCHEGVNRNCDGKCPCTPECLEQCKGKGYKSKVCGTDGLEYDECTIECHDGVKKDCRGTCPCIDKCLEKCNGNEPKVCGSDGNEYDECSVKCYPTVTRDCGGTCPCKEVCLKKCTGNEPKVCGTDGKEYDKCSIKCETEVTEKCDGPCPCIAPCLKKCSGYDLPVCGTDGKDYDECTIKCHHGVSKNCDGKCPCEEECLKECKGDEAKVCGKDGKEYTECTIKCYREVTKKCDEPCPCTEECLDKCTGYEPKVCGTDGKEY